MSEHHDFAARWGHHQHDDLDDDHHAAAVHVAALPCGQALGASCGDGAVPSSLTGKIDKSIAALDAAANQTGKQAKRTLAKARKLLKAAAALAKRSARGKEPKLSAECADCLRTALGALTASAPR